MTQQETELIETDNGVLGNDSLWASQTLNIIMDSVNEYKRAHKQIAMEEMRGLYSDILNIEVKKLRQKLHEEFYGTPNSFGIEDVINSVCNYYATTPDMLEIKSRKRVIIEPKQLLHWMLRNRIVKNSLTLEQIGKFTGGQDHCTVIHGFNTVTDRIQHERAFREDVMQLCNKLGARTFWNGNRLEISHEF